LQRQLIAGLGGFGLGSGEISSITIKSNTPLGRYTFFMKITFVGLIPLAAVEILDEEMLNRVPDFKRQVEWVLIIGFSI
jgi:preprotein translocase subunit SecG